MLNEQIINPKSIVIVGASNQLEKPGGRILKNILDNNYSGKLYAVNPKESEVQGIKCHKSVDSLENVDLAIIAIAAKFIPETVEILAKQKNSKAFIILSAGFSEVGGEGKILEKQVASIIDSVGGCLIGPNCIGVLTTHYKGVFAGPIPQFDPQGCDFVSGSGATAVFILEGAISMGLKFSTIFSVGNSASIGVEEVLQYWDENYEPETSSKIKLIYIEQITKPKLFLKHASSLIRKGCRIAAIKPGTTEDGSRAVSSHTGALAGSDTAVDALFKKAGIVRCYSKQELLYVAGIFTHKKFTGGKIAVITHAGGPGVMLTDTLSKNGIKVPHLEGKNAEELLSNLFYGSSVANPIDFLATGNAEQLGIILDFVDNKFDNIDASVVIFGTPGLFDVKPVYEVLNKKMNECRKPIFPVLPSIVQAKDAIEYFESQGFVHFTDEVVLGEALAKTFFTPEPQDFINLPEIDYKTVRQVINENIDGYLEPEAVQKLLDAAGISRVPEKIVNKVDDLNKIENEFGFPLAAKVIGIIHKSEACGVILNINSKEDLLKAYNQLMKIEGAKGVLVQKMLIGGIELFAGAKLEQNFGHIILCGLGGIFVEILKDISYGLSPLSIEEAKQMLAGLKSRKMLEGFRGKEKVNELLFAEILTRLSALVEAAPEILEMDLNPLLGSNDKIIAVDARIKISK